MNPIELAVLSDDIEEVGYWMDRQPFDVDGLILLAQSDYMRSYLIQYGANEEIQSFFIPCLPRSFVITISKFIYNHFIR